MTDIMSYIIAEKQKLFSGGWRKCTSTLREDLSCNPSIHRRQITIPVTPTWGTLPPSSGPMYTQVHVGAHISTHKNKIILAGSGSTEADRALWSSRLAKVT